MGGMTTLQPNESINDHAKESVSLLNRLAEIAKEAYKYLPEKDCTLETGVLLNVDSRTFYSAIEHIRESIQMLDELCDELEDDLRDERKQYEHDMECIRKYGTQSVDAEKLFEQLNEDLDHFRNLAISRNKELDYALKQVEFWKKLAKYSAHYVDTDIAHMYPKTTLNNPCNFCGNCKYYSAPLTPEEAQYCKHDIVVTRDVGTCNNKWASPYIVDPDDASCPHFESNQVDSDKSDHPCNFCGNCRYYTQMGKDNGDFENICTQHYIKRVDPDDASCPHFKSNQVDRDKPDHPCCEACNRDDCDNCTLCPF